MAVLSNTGIRAGASAAGGGGYQIEKSVRFESDDAACLKRTPSSSGDRQKWTISFWFKDDGILPDGGLSKLHEYKSYGLFDRKHDNWSKINFLRGVNSLIMVDKYVTSLPSFFIEGLKKFELDQGVINMCNYVTSKDDCRNFNFSISNNKLIDGLYTGI